MPLGGATSVSSGVAVGCKSGTSARESVVVEGAIAPGASFRSAFSVSTGFWEVSIKFGEAIAFGIDINTVLATTTAVMTPLGAAKHNIRKKPILIITSPQLLNT